MTPRDDIDFSDDYSSDSIESGLEEIITESRSSGRSVTWDDDPRDDEGSDVPAMLAATEARVDRAEAAAEYAEGLAAETAFAMERTLALAQKRLDDAGLELYRAQETLASEREAWRAEKRALLEDLVRAREDALVAVRAAADARRAAAAAAPPPGSAQKDLDDAIARLSLLQWLDDPAWRDLRPAAETPAPAATTPAPTYAAPAPAATTPMASTTPRRGDWSDARAPMAATPAPAADTPAPAADTPAPAADTPAPRRGDWSDARAPPETPPPLEADPSRSLESLVEEVKRCAAKLSRQSESPLSDAAPGAY